MSSIHRLAPGLCLEEGAACCLLLVCTSPCLGSLVVSPGSFFPFPSPGDLSPCGSESGPVQRRAQHTGPSRAAGLVLQHSQRRLLVRRAGSLLVGGEAHTAFIFVACVTWMPPGEMMLSDWSLQLFLHRSLGVCGWAPPLSEGPAGLGVPLSLPMQGGSLGAPHRHLQHHRADRDCSVLRDTLSSLGMFGVF